MILLPAFLSPLIFTPSSVTTTFSPVLSKTRCVVVLVTPYHLPFVRFLITGLTRFPTTSIFTGAFRFPTFSTVNSPITSASFTPSLQPSFVPPINPSNPLAFFCANDFKVGSSANISKENGINGLSMLSSYLISEFTFACPFTASPLSFSKVNS